MPTEKQISSHHVFKWLRHEKQTLPAVRRIKSWIDETDFGGSVLKDAESVQKNKPVTCNKLCSRSAAHRRKGPRTGRVRRLQSPTRTVSEANRTPLWPHRSSCVDCYKHFFVFLLCLSGRLVSEVHLECLHQGSVPHVHKSEVPLSTARLKKGKS